MPFAIDYGSGFQDFGRAAGQTAAAFTEIQNKQRLVDAEVKRSATYEQAIRLQTERDRYVRARQALGDRAAQDLVKFAGTWLGPDRSFAGVDAQGNPMPLDVIRRSKVAAWQAVAKNMPADQASAWLAVQQRELEEEIMDSARQDLQDRLGNLQMRLKMDPTGLQADAYSEELEQAIEGLEDPYSDVGAAEEVFRRIQGIVEKETVRQGQLQLAMTQIQTFRQQIADQGGDTEELDAIYGALVAGLSDPQDARRAAVDTVYGTGGARKWKPPGLGGKEVEINSSINRGRGRSIESMDDASAAESFMLGVEMARQDPDFDMLTQDEQKERAEDYATLFARSGGWFVPPGWVPPSRRPQGFEPGSPEAADDLRQRAAAGEFKSDKELRDAMKASGFEAAAGPPPQGAGKGPAGQKPRPAGVQGNPLPKNGKIQPPGQDALAAFPPTDQGVATRDWMGSLDYDGLMDLAQEAGMAVEDYKAPNYFDPYATPSRMWDKRTRDKKAALKADPSPQEVLTFLEKKQRSNPDDHWAQVGGQPLSEVILNLKAMAPRFEQMQKLRAVRLRAERMGYSGPEDPQALLQWAQGEYDSLLGLPGGLGGERQAKVRKLASILALVRPLAGVSDEKSPLRTRSGPKE